ncbi:MAG: GIY-YIG nuclease family protein [Halobacteria archaeon]|nr:GIY-YIG nuclease family protein [Halobacteria archaeon]
MSPKDDTQGGIYTLVLRLEDDTAIEVGALGEIEFESGLYAYTGSALGRGGFSRVERHRDVSEGENDTRRWHIDYLNGDARTSIVEVVKSPGVEEECEISRRIEGERIGSFGASDSECDSHLVYSEEETDEFLETVREAHTSVSGDT